MDLLKDNIQEQYNKIKNRYNNEFKNPETLKVAFTNIYNNLNTKYFQFAYKLSSYNYLQFYINNDTYRKVINIDNETKLFDVKIYEEYKNLILQLIEYINNIYSFTGMTNLPLIVRNTKIITTLHQNFDSIYNSIDSKFKYKSFLDDLKELFDQFKQTHNKSNANSFKLDCLVSQTLKALLKFYEKNNIDSDILEHLNNTIQSPNCSKYYKNIKQIKYHKLHINNWIELYKFICSSYNYISNNNILKNKKYRIDLYNDNIKITPKILNDMYNKYLIIQSVIFIFLNSVCNNLINFFYTLDDYKKELELYQKIMNNVSYLLQTINNNYPQELINLKDIFSNIISIVNKDILQESNDEFYKNYGIGKSLSLQLGGFNQISLKYSYELLKFKYNLF